MCSLCTGHASLTTHAAPDSECFYNFVLQCTCLLATVIFNWEVYRPIYGQKSRFTAPSRVAEKLNFRPYIRQYTNPLTNENFEYSYPQTATFSLCEWDQISVQQIILQPWYCTLLRFLSTGNFSLCECHQESAVAHHLQIFLPNCNKNRLLRL